MTMPQQDSKISWHPYAEHEISNLRIFVSEEAELLVEMRHPATDVNVQPQPGVTLIALDRDDCYDESAQSGQGLDDIRNTHACILLRCRSRCNPSSWPPGFQISSKSILLSKI